MQSLHIVYASGSGHTQYAVQEVVDVLTAGGITVTTQVAEKATEADFAKNDNLMLASGTWNTGGKEGQVHLYMFELLYKKAADADLTGKNVFVMGLGDSRYRHTSWAAKHLAEYVQSHGGTVVGKPFRVINEPYGQEESIRTWANDILTSLSS